MFTYVCMYLLFVKNLGAAYFAFYLLGDADRSRSRRNDLFGPGFGTGTVKIERLRLRKGVGESGVKRTTGAK